MNKNILNFNISSPRGESNCSSVTSYSCERGVGEDADRATKCAMTSVGNVSKNNLQQNQPSCLAALSPAASSEINHSPLTTHYSLKRKSAFTLTEVLITLGIIGVVAALTLPTLIQNYKKSVVVNKLKTSYSILNEAVLQSVAENGEYQNWNFSDTDKFVETYILPYLKTVKVCGKFNRQKGCFKSMPNGNDGWMELTGNYSRNDFFHYYKFILANGSSVGIRTVNNAAAQIYIDIDGPSKGKSKIGEDVFYFQILNGTPLSGWYKAKGNPLIAGSECADGAPHINQTIETLLDGAKCQRGGCSLTSSNANVRNVGEACSAVIIKNSWKIPDNYPVRF